LAALGLVKGDRVGVLAGGNAELVAALYGTWKLGAIAVLLNPQLPRATQKGRPRTPRPEHAGASVIVADQDPARWSAATGVGGRAGGTRVVRPKPHSPAAPTLIHGCSGGSARSRRPLLIWQQGRLDLTHGTWRRGTQGSP
jgi:hypothetical protein